MSVKLPPEASDKDVKLQPEAEALRQLRSVDVDAIVELGPGLVATAESTPEGWRLTASPLDWYRRDTPLHALRALVWASRAGKWEQLHALAPARYRAKMTPNTIQQAWTDGPGSEYRRSLRDDIAQSLHLGLELDTDFAVLRTAGGRSIRLEREGEGWVVAGF